MKEERSLVIDDFNKKSQLILIHEKFISIDKNKSIGLTKNYKKATFFEKHTSKQLRNFISLHAFNKETVQKIR